MAKDTPKGLRNQVMYSVFVRNHTPQGTFEGVRQDLPRIRELGVEVIWLMPIHPLGEKCRKGTLGSPYAIRDYREVNPEFGTLADFQALVEDIHRLGMKCIIDVVYNHTSPDSVLAQTHPEWFYHRADGSMGNHIGDWTDVVDLDYTHRELWDYQIETLKYWAGMVDGFRCDVAPMVPLDFWKRAREEVAEVRPGCIWLAESGEPPFLTVLRDFGLTGLSDSELYQAFDLCYDYDCFDHFQSWAKGELPLGDYLDRLNGQEAIYPENYVKLRFLENHDRIRGAALCPDPRALRNWTAFLFFQKGMPLVYGGQEMSCTHRPSLFDADPVNWAAGEDLSGLIRALSAAKGHPLMAEGTFHARALPRETVYAVLRRGERQLVGVFSLRGEWGAVEVEAPDGVYTDLITGKGVEVELGTLSFTGEPVIFEAPVAPPRRF